MQLDPVVQTVASPLQPRYERMDIPEDITTFGGDELAELFTKLTGWADFFASKLVEAQLEERECQLILDRENARMLVARMGSATKGDKVTLIKAEISIDPKIIKLEDRVESAYAFRKTYEMILNNHERDLTLVSREITRRASEQRQRSM
jgi:hypothetical protein